MRDELFRLVIDYATPRGLLRPVTSENAALAELSSRVFRSAFVIRLSEPTTEELKALVTAGAVVIALGGGDTKATIPVAAAALVRRLKKAQKEYGEVSILDAVQELQRQSLLPTADSVSRFLFGNPCRYPASGCRYIASNGTCSFRPDAVSTTMQAMVKDEKLLAKNSVEPIEYAIV